MRTAIVLPVLLILVLAMSGCEMTRGERAGVGVGVGAGTGAALGSAIGYAFGVPGLGAIIGAGGGALIGGVAGALWPDEGSDNEREARKLSAKGLMSYEELVDTLVASRLSPEWQNEWLAQAAKINRQVEQLGKKAVFSINPGIGIQYNII